MTARVITLRDGRRAEVVPADDAGQFTVRVADGIVDQMQQAELLTWRQAEALNEMARLHRAGGGAVAGRRSGAGGVADEEDVEAARHAFAALLEAVPVAMRGPLLSMAATREWPVSPGVTVRRVQDAADAVADRMRLPRE